MFPLCQYELESAGAVYIIVIGPVWQRISILAICFSGCKAQMSRVLMKNACLLKGIAVVVMIGGVSQLLLRGVQVHATGTTAGTSVNEQWWKAAAAPTKGSTSDGRDSASSVSHTDSLFLALEALQSVSDEILSEIEIVQDPSKLGRTCTEVRLFVADLFPAGFGAQMGFFMNELMTATRKGRVLIVRGDFGYSGGCPFGMNRTNSLSCFFAPVGPCVAQNSWTEADLQAGQIPAYAPPLSKPFATPDDVLAPIAHSDGHYDFYHDNVDDLQNYPPKYRSLGIPFWRSRFTLRIMKLQPEIDDMLHHAKQQIGWPSRHLSCNRCICNVALLLRQHTGLLRTGHARATWR
jgi:hypothetical protein